MLTFKELYTLCRFGTNKFKSVLIKLDLFKKSDE